MLSGVAMRCGNWKNQAQFDGNGISKGVSPMCTRRKKIGGVLCSVYPGKLLFTGSIGTYSDERWTISFLISSYLLPCFDF